jgi:MerR family transcriptional regulator, light-induced transcriptional regulator
MTNLHYFPREMVHRIAHDAHMHFLALVAPPVSGDVWHRREKLNTDLEYSLEALDVAMTLDDDRLFPCYATWVLELMCRFLSETPRQTVVQQFSRVLECLRDALRRTLPAAFAEQAALHVTHALEGLARPSVDAAAPAVYSEGPYARIRADYLSLTLQGRSREAVGVVRSALSSGLPVETLYLDVLRPAQIELGRLWFTREITVAAEHAGTKTTQKAMAVCYPTILEVPSRGRRAMTCCVGGELHDLGVHMISDLFELHGWDCQDLGSSVPEEAVVGAVSSFHPELVAMSVTMPEHLPLCRDLVCAVRRTDPRVKIAVGGQAFAFTDRVWQRWDVDFHSDDAVALIDWAESLPPAG